MQIKAALSSDEDGFVSRECPTCLGRFKAAISAGNIYVRYCPYCGHGGEDCWWTPEQMEYLRALALRELQPELDAMFDGVAKPGGLITITVERTTPELPVPPLEHSGSYDVQTCETCNAAVKVESARLVGIDGAISPFVCIECGVTHAMRADG